MKQLPAIGGLVYYSCEFICKKGERERERERKKISPQHIISGDSELGQLNDRHSIAAKTLIISIHSCECCIIYRSPF